ncbi:MAG: FMN-binding negative transcriptional regulator [Stellaceae bacterium]
MYLPADFREDRVDMLHQAIRQIALGTLVTLGEDGLFASHVPMLVDAEPAPFGTLTGHIARANPQWQSLKPEVDALAVFTGPHAYVSPGWYATKRETGKVVPTWNYVAIHATGRLRFFDDAERLRGIVTRLTDSHEQRRAEPWKVTDAPADFIAGMLKAIVGFELTIAKLEGKWKMSQNRPAADHAGIVEGLAGEGGAPEVAAIVAAVTKPAGKD